MNIAVIDDIPAEIAVIEKILYSISEKICIKPDISCFRSGEEFLEIFEESAFDIVFMDIYMKGMTGIETARALRKKDPHCLLVFLTESTEHMPEAFSCHAFEYIQKPFTEKRVARVISDVMDILPVKTQYIEFNVSRQAFHMLYSDFVMAVAEGHYLNITDIKGKTYRTRQTFSEFTALLNGDGRFLQINKGIIVNMEHIVSIDDNICTLKSGQNLPVKIRGNLKIKEIWYHYGFEQIRTEQKRRK